MKKETSSDKLTTRIDKKAKKVLKIIKEESDGLITPRYILEQYAKEYCSTDPNGLKIKTKEIEKKIEKVEKNINNLHEDKTKLVIELKTYKDTINKSLVSYVDEKLNNAVNGVIKIYNQKNFDSIEEIPEQTFIAISKHHRIDTKLLKEEVKKKFGIKP